MIPYNIDNRKIPNWKISNRTQTAAVGAAHQRKVKQYRFSIYVDGFYILHGKGEIESHICTPSFRRGISAYGEYAHE